jgi:hypothetical protein
VEYGESMPEIVKSQVIEMVRGHMEEVFEPESEELEQLESAMEIWAASEKRELQERFDTEQVIEAAAQIVERTPDLELKMKMDHISVRGLLADFGDMIHLAKVGDKYVLLIEADSVVFEKGFSPVEFLKPDRIEDVIGKIQRKQS